MIKRYDLNKYKIKGDVTEIYIHNYKTQELIGTILIDTENFEKVKDYKWVYNHCGYARNNKKGLMHRFIISAKDNEIIDHINQNKLDNRKCNLRIANKSINRLNSDKCKGYTIKKRKKGNVYTAYIRIDGKQFYLGTYDDENIAHQVYLNKRKEVYGI